MSSFIRESEKGVAIFCGLVRWGNVDRGEDIWHASLAPESPTRRIRKLGERPRGFDISGPFLPELSFEASKGPETTTAPAGPTASHLREFFYFFRFVKNICRFFFCKNIILPPVHPAEDRYHRMNWR